MSQPWINNIPEVDWHGANGSIIIGPEPAADRYTEARLAKSVEVGMLSNVKKDTVPMQLNFTEDEEWPVVFPSIFPRLFVNGSQGIGYTIANVWLPGNLSEFVEVVEKYLKTNELDYSNLYPDFPTGGIIINKKDISNIWKTGKGKVILRGTTEIKDNKILITELPYQVYVEPFIAQIKDLIAKDEITGIDDVINKSNKKQILIEVVCGSQVNPQKVLVQLFKSTDLQKNFNANQYALTGKVPELLNLQDYIDIYVRHNSECILKEFTYDLNKAKARLEIVEGMLIILDNIDRAIELIKNSKDSNDAVAQLQKEFGLTERQAESITSMKLTSLAKKSIDTLLSEKEGLLKDIAGLEACINSKDGIKNEFLARLKDFESKFRYNRRTQVMQIEETKEKIEEIPPEDCVVIVTKDKFIKRVATKNFKVQHKNGAGIKNNSIAIFTAKTNTQDMLLIFTSLGKVFRVIVNDIPDTSKGVPISSLIKLENNEEPLAYSSLYNNTTAKYIIFVTKNGTVKKSEIEEITSIKKSTGVKVINLREGDSVAAVTFIDNETLIITSRSGHVLRFDPSFIAPLKRVAMGVKGIQLGDKDEVIACLPVKHETDTLLTVDADGNIKRTNLDVVPVQSRGIKGPVICNGLCGATLVDDNDSVLVCGDKSSICIAAQEVSSFKTKNATGTKILKNNIITSVTKI